MQMKALLAYATMNLKKMALWAEKQDETPYFFAMMHKNRFINQKKKTKPIFLILKNRFVFSLYIIYNIYITFL